jgi:hypothetical protein
MTIPYILRRPRFPVIVVAGDRAFRALSSAAVQKLLRRELTTGAEIRLLDYDWRWFIVLTGKVCAIAPSIADYQQPTKQEVIDLVNGRANKADGSTSYQRRSLSSRSREEVFQELLAMLPSG